MNSKLLFVQRAMLIIRTLNRTFINISAYMDLSPQSAKL